MSAMRWRFLWAAVSLVAAPLAVEAGCGTTVVADDSSTTSTAHDAGKDARAHDAAFPPDARPEDASHDAFEDYSDPGCPDAGPPTPALDCDPYHQGNGDCPPDQGCYIYVQYPADACTQEVYGAACAPAGTGTQGQGCEQELCAPGFACVVSGEGVQCVQLCNLSGDAGCPPGLVCEPIDVQGFGGCL
jgi:hypothetical protein